MTNTKNLYNNIRTHVESHYPMLYFVTFEEQQADDLIRELAAEDNRKVVEWDLARGEVDFKNKK